MSRTRPKLDRLLSALKYRKLRGSPIKFSQLQSRLVKSWLLKLTKLKEVICAYCEEPVAKEDWSIDHFLPLSRGGKNNIRNMVMSCYKCNKAKGDMTGEEFRHLLEFLSTWEGDGRKLLIRLRSAGYRYGGR